MSKASRERAELKKQKIRELIFKQFNECVDKGLSSEKSFEVVNFYIEQLKKQNPQESHFVSSVCIEIRQNVNAFCEKMLKSKEVI